MQTLKQQEMPLLLSSTFLSVGGNVRVGAFVLQSQPITQPHMLCWEISTPKLEVNPKPSVAGALQDGLLLDVGAWICVYLAFTKVLVRSAMEVGTLLFDRALERSRIDVG